jgi:hypothetical protein
MPALIFDLVDLVELFLPPAPWQQQKLPCSKEFPSCFVDHGLDE